MSLVEEMVRQRPAVTRDAARHAVEEGHVRVDGRVIQNVNAKVPVGCSLVVAADKRLRGEEKLGQVLDALTVPVVGRTVLDVGAAAGGFTRALLARGALRVYAVDVGHGQLIGSLRQDPRVVNLEATNVADLDGALVPDAVNGVTVDVSYLSLTDAVRSLDRVALTEDCWLVGLVKPMFELARGGLPTGAADLADAVERARDGVASAGWAVSDSVRSDVGGANGAVEFFVYATRAAL